MLKITLRGRTLYLLMKIVCGVSFMMYGYDAGVLGGVLLHQPFLDAIGNPTGNYVIPMIVASYDLAACVTAVGIAFFAFRMGRRGTVILGNIVAIVSGGTMYFLPDTPRWYYARNRWEEGDAALAQLNDPDVQSEQV